MLMLRLSFSTGKIFVKLFVDFEPRAEPDLEFEGLLKRQHTRVKYFQGSLMNAMDLERAKVAATPKKRKSTKTHLVIVSHPRDAFLDRRPSASKALLLQN